MSDALDSLMVARSRMDPGVGASWVVSVGGHLAILVGFVVWPLIVPPEPPLKVVMGTVIPIPRGGGGTPDPPAPAAAQAPPAPQVAPPVTAPPAPPPKVAKPPREEPKRAVPDPDAKKARPKATPPPTRAASSSTTPKPGDARASGRTGGTGTNATPGLAIGGPAGPGSPTGTALDGDWYLAGVQSRIWSVWTRQIQSGRWNPVVVSFTILADGRIENVQVVQKSGVFALDMAAQRAVESAAPFAPLPREYGTNRFTIQAEFRPLEN